MHRACHYNCVYQTDGICVLDDASLSGYPMSKACLRPTLINVNRLGSPHQYCGPESDLTPPAFSVLRPDMPE